MSSSSTPSSSSGSVNLSKMIRLDQVEELLNTMMARLDSQEQTIEQLQRLCSSLLSKNSANEVFDGMQRSISSLSSRIDRVQTAATADMGNSQLISAGELSYLNSAEIQKIKAEIQTLSRRAETMQQFEDLNSSLSGDLNILRAQMTPLEMGLSLQDAHNSASQRIAGVEAMIACKLDRSEVGNLMTLASRLESFASFKDNTLATFIQHDRLHGSLSDRIQANSAHLASHDSALKDVDAVLQSKASIASVLDVQKQADNLAAQLRLCASSKSVQAADEKIAVLSSRMNSKDVCDVDVDVRLRHAFSDIANRATLEQLRACVLRSHYDAAISALGTDLDTKADNSQFQVLSATVGNIGSVQEEEAQKLKVAMRFVDWFTSRGENYEHNLKLVDKHLRNLAVAANPADRVPFSGQVRYTPYMDQENVPEGL